MGRILLIVSLAACSGAEADLDRYRFVCDGGEACPAGQACVAGYCAEPGGEGGEGGEGAEGEADPGPDPGPGPGEGEGEPPQPGGEGEGEPPDPVRGEGEGEGEPPQPGGEGEGEGEGEPPTGGEDEGEGEPPDECDEEILCNGIDEDCDGLDDDHPNTDGDAYDICHQGVPGADDYPVDCNDDDRNIHPGLDPVCNGVDDNCDGIIDVDAPCDDEWCSEGRCTGFLLDDDAEPNDSREQATYLTEGIHQPFVHLGENDDFFAISVCEGERVQVDMYFIDATGDLDVMLQRNNGTQVISAQSVDDNETINVAALGTGWYYLQVREIGLAQTNVYALSVRTPGCDCEHECGRSGLTDCDGDPRQCRPGADGCLAWQDADPRECDIQ